MVLDAAPGAVAVYDVCGRRIRANDKAVALLGADRRGDRGSVAGGLVCGVLRCGADAFGEERVVVYGDEVVTLSWQCQVMRRRDGEVVGALLIGDDPSRLARLQALAMTDQLTGVLNHGAFRERLAAEIELACRHGTPLALAMLDIDEFKVVNDTFGHQVGDRVLVDVAATIAEHIRASDVLARLGGDEFAILMPQTDGPGAAVIAQRVHAEVGAMVVADGQRVTLSVGVCALDDGEAPEELVARADRLLYASKRHGRDRVWRCDHAHDPPRDALMDSGASASLAPSQTAAAVRALARAIDLKDAATRQHSDRVAELAVRLAAAIGWPPQRCELIRQTAVVHDVGKVAVPDAILLKPDRLSDSEYAIVRRHAELGAQIAAEILTPEQTAWLRGHHERVDGTGYPDGLTGEQIPDGAAILAVSDAYDVMVCDRPYAPARDPTDALEELRRCAGTQFAVQAVEAFHTPGIVRLINIHANQEHARTANQAAVTALDGRQQLRCECAEPACTACVRVSSDELRAVRAHQRRFILADGHQLPDVERVVARHRRFIVVEKRV